MSKAKAIVTVPSLLPVLTKVAARNNIPKDRIFLFGSESIDGFKSYYSIATTSSKASFSIQGRLSSDDIAFICFSSGTTGLAKGVMLTHKNFVAQMTIITEFEQTDPNQDDSIILGFLPFYHIFGLTTLVFRAFYCLTTVVVIPKYDLELVCRLVEKYKITTAAIVPPVGKRDILDSIRLYSNFIDRVAVQLAKSDIPLKYDLSSLRTLTSGAAPLGHEHIEALNARIKAYVRQG